MDGRKNFVRLAVAIGDKRSLQRIERGVHPCRDEFTDRRDWPLPEEVTA